MAEQYRFFDSAEDDIREYTAAEFAEYFSRFLSDGLYAENGKAGLQVTPGIGLQVQIAPGYAFVRGYMYHNDATLSFALDPADTMLDRIDRVVLRFDEVAREIRLAVKTGSFSSTPTAPELEVTSTVKELGLAQVRIHKGTTSLTVKDITDERLTSACGLVSSLIDIPAQEMWDVWNKALDDIEVAWAQQTASINQEWQQQTAAIDGDWQAQTGGVNTDWDTIKANWQAWFDSVKTTLGSRFFSGPAEPVDIQPGDHWLKEV